MKNDQIKRMITLSGFHRINNSQTDLNEFNIGIESWRSAEVENPVEPWAEKKDDVSFE